LENENLGHEIWIEVVAQESAPPLLSINKKQKSKNKKQKKASAIRTLISRDLSSSQPPYFPVSLSPRQAR